MSIFYDFSLSFYRQLANEHAHRHQALLPFSGSGIRLHASPVGPVIDILTCRQHMLKRTPSSMSTRTCIATQREKKTRELLVVHDLPHRRVHRRSSTEQDKCCPPRKKKWHGFGLRILPTNVVVVCGGDSRDTDAGAVTS